MVRTLYVLLAAFVFCTKVNAQQCGEFGTIVISEVHFDTRYEEHLSSSYHSYGEYIELYNSSDQPINLENWTIRDNHTAYVFRNTSVNNSQHLTIAAGGYKIITFDGFHNTENGYVTGREKFTELFPEALGHELDIIVQKNIVLYNDVDKISLYNHKNRLIDQVSYLNTDNTNAFSSTLEPRDYMGIPGQPYTIDIIPRLFNGGGGIFNGAIGEIIVDNNGTSEIIYHPEYKQAIYRSIAADYYTSGNISFAVATATPFSIPFTIPTRTLDPFLMSAPDGSGGIFNETESLSYDILNQSEIGHTKTFFNQLGNPLVTISRDYKNGYVWGTETTYDSFTRKSKESFPAVTCH